MADNMDKGPLDKVTPTLEQISQKHGVGMKLLRKQLQRGTEVEREHTNDEDAAREIALDHLNERADYYEQLEKVETSVKRPSPFSVSSDAKPIDSDINTITAGPLDDALRNQMANNPISPTSGKLLTSCTVGRKSRPIKAYVDLTDRTCFPMKLNG
jgi:hypothetical protein